MTPQNGDALIVYGIVVLIVIGAGSLICAGYRYSNRDRLACEAHGGTFHEVEVMYGDGDKRLLTPMQVYTVGRCMLPPNNHCTVSKSGLTTCERSVS